MAASGPGLSPERRIVEIFCTPVENHTVHRLAGLISAPAGGICSTATPEPLGCSTRPMRAHSLITTRRLLPVKSGMVKEPSGIRLMTVSRCPSSMARSVSSAVVGAAAGTVAGGAGAGELAASTGMGVEG